MRRPALSLAVLSFCLAGLLVAPAVSAQEDDDAAVDPPAEEITEEETDQGATDEGDSEAEQLTEPSGLVPAVEIADEVPEEGVRDWTYRYLIPTGLVLVVLIVLFTSVRYFTDVVRSRYRIVEE